MRAFFLLTAAVAVSAVVVVHQVRTSPPPEAQAAAPLVRLGESRQVPARSGEWLVTITCYPTLAPRGYAGLLPMVTYGDVFRWVALPWNGGAVLAAPDFRNRVNMLRGIPPDVPIDSLSIIPIGPFANQAAAATAAAQVNAWLATN